MAIITKIRNQSTLLIVTIGVAMAAFVVGGDFLTSSGSLLNQENDIAEIAGNTISFRDFEERIEREINQNYGNQSIPSSERENMRQAVWSLLMHEQIMYPQYDELGLMVTPEELFQQINSKAPSQRLQRFFTDPQTGRVIQQFADPITGALDAEKVVSYLKQLFESDQASQWIPIEREIKIERYSQKYFNLLKKGLYVTAKEAEEDFVNKNKTATIRYVVKKYSDVADSTIAVTDSELESYYRENNYRAQYKQEDDTRTIDYVVFDVLASDDDKATLRGELEQIKMEFAQSDNDTLFVLKNADNRNNIAYYSEGEMPSEVDSILFNSDSAGVVGPYADGATYKLAKVIGTIYRSDSVDARHILVKINEGDTAVAQAKVDSLENLIKKGADFAELAKTNSEDFGSGQNGGDLGWFTEGRMVPSFNDACFEGKIGDRPIVSSQFGIHLIEIVNKTKEKKKQLIAVVDREIQPSKATYEAAYNEASAFSINNNTTDAFKSKGNELGMRVASNLKEADKTIAGLDSPREIVRWAYASEIGEVSEPFDQNNKFVIAHLSEIKPKGILPLESVKDLVEIEVIKEKKAEQFIAELSGSTSVDDAAQKIGGKPENLDNLTFSQFSIPGLGAESELIGKIFTLEQGQTSIPVKGVNGVYVFTLDQLSDATPSDVTANVGELTRNYQGRVDYEVFNALEKGANIVDNRGKFY